MGQLDVDVIGMVMGCCWIDGGLPILGLPLPLPLPLQRGRLPHPDRAPLRSVRAPFSGSGHRSPVPCVPDPKRPSSSTEAGPTRLRCTGNFYLNFALYMQEFLFQCKFHY